MRHRRLVIATSIGVAVLVGAALTTQPINGKGAGSAGRVCVPTWRTATSPRIEDGVLLGVGASSEADAWAVGGVIRRDEYGEEIVSAAPLIEHWNGARWSLVQGLNARGALVDVAVTSGSDAWAIGWKGLNPRVAAPLLLHWDGRRWSEFSLPTTIGDVSSVSALGPRDVWLVGSAGIFHWNGTSWTTSRRAGGLIDVTAISSRDVWVVGAAGENRFVALHWDGTGWRAFVRRVSPGYQWPELSTVAGLSRNDVWAGGHEHSENLSPGALEPVLLHWNGRRWSVASMHSSGYTGISDIAPLSSAEAWAVSENDIDYATDSGSGSALWHWIGGRWRASELANGRSLSNIAVVPGASRAVWAVGSIGTASTTYDGYFPERTVPLIRRFGC